MGSGLRRPVTTLPITRRCGEKFCIGMAEMNGFRNSMEDSHVIYMVDNWGFFGVFDGHGGSQCSGYVARRMQEELQFSGLPKDDAAVRALVFRLDQEFLDQDTTCSGSTATFAIVEGPEEQNDLHTIRVCNIGDSRVLLGRYDGTMVEGFGTDGGLTTDHKPNNSIERARIEKAGGWVKEAGSGVHRVNGELAVSRAFGDIHFKKCDALHEDGGLSHPEDRIVSAEPEFCTLQCDSSNFLLLVCDGISEGNFPNREVVELAALQLREHSDPARAAIAICRKALVRDSRDNLSCMVVLLRGDQDNTLRHLPEEELLPGEFWDMLGDTKFKDAYERMSIRGGSTIADCVERRFDRARQDLGMLEALHACEPTADECKDAEDIFVWNPENGHGSSIEQKIKALQSEIMALGDTPPPLGCPTRTEWFREFVDSRTTSPVDRLQQLPAGIQADLLPNVGKSEGLEAQLARLIQENNALEAQIASAEETKLNRVLMETSDEEARIIRRRESGLERTSSEVSTEPDESEGILSGDDTSSAELNLTQTRTSRPYSLVRVTRDEDLLRQAFEAHPELAWSDRLLEACGKQGMALEVDPDGTSQVRFEAPLSFRAWLPTSVLDTCFQEQDSVKVAKLEDLMQAIQRHPALTWEERLEVTCDKEGRVIKVDDDETVYVQFEGRKAAWLPTDALTLC